MEEDMIKNNKSYTGPNGKTYGPEHYKKAVEYDKKQLQRIQKKEKLANAMSKAGVGKGIAGAINGDAVKKVASDLGKGITEGVRNMVPRARTGVSKDMAKSIGRAASEVGQEVLSGGLSKARTGGMKEMAKPTAGLAARAVTGARTGGLTSKIQGLKDAEEKALKRRKK